MTKIPHTDSIQKLARFWDTHDLTEFEGELEEVQERAFARKTPTIVRIRLQPGQAKALKRVAQSKGMKQADLVKKWVNEKLRAS